MVVTAGRFLLAAVLAAASGLNQLKRRVEALELDAGVGGCKAPVSLDVVSVTVEEPGINLTLEHVLVADTPIETLAGQDGELGTRPN